MRDAPFRGSRAIYRLLLRAYPRAFRDRFADDLEADLARLIAEQGRASAWRRAIVDLTRSLPITHTHARAVHRRRRATSYKEESVMSSVMFDLRLAVRALLKAPVFTSVTILTLALGIGANSAIFSLVNAVLLRPLGYERPERLMFVYEGIADRVAKMTVSPPDFLDLREYQRSFSAIGAYRAESYELSGAGMPEQIVAARVSPSVFPILGVNPLLGRTFLESEGQPGQDLAVLSYGLWQSRFGANPGIVGQRVTLDRRPYTIVGVMPASFQFPKRGPQFNGEPAQLWTPLGFEPFERQARGMMYNHSVVGRLREGVSVEQASADIRALAPRIAANYPPDLKNAGLTITLTPVPLLEEIAGQVQRPLMLLLAAVGVVLLVACANVANLVLSRAASREREIGVRAALGAGKRRLAQMLLLESSILGLAGGALGLVVGYWSVRSIPAVIAVSLPGVMDVALDMRVVAFAFALSIGTAVIFGLAPLTTGLRRDANDVLREGTSRSTGGARSHRIQSALVVSSVALAFVLSIGAGLLIRSFAELMTVNTGIRPANVVTMQVRLPNAGYSSAASVKTFYRSLYDRLSAIPGARTASLVTDLPLKSDGERRAFTPDSPHVEALSPGGAVTWVCGNYFATFGIPIERGRTFLPEEETRNSQVAIVSRAIADRFWPGQDPIGKRLKWGIAVSTQPWKTIVGVVGDVVDGGLTEEPIIHIYVPYSEMPDGLLDAPGGKLGRQIHLAALSSGDAHALIAPMRAAVAALDPALAVADVTTMAQVMSDASAPQRFSTIVLGGFAFGALLLAAVGLYGVLAFGVAQRTREIGVRLALGASRGSVLGLVVREGMAMTAVGLLLGTAGALAITRLMRALLYEVQPFDAITFASVPPILVAVALLACYLPARRAANVDPMAALRTE